MILSITLVTTVLLSGCQPPQPASLSNDQVVSVVDNILTGINTRDYPAFSQDFSPNLAAAIPETQFTGLALMLRKANGNYISCADAQPELSNSQGYAVYRINCKFEVESVIVTVTFKTGAAQVEGLYFDSANLRKLGQSTPTP